MKLETFLETVPFQCGCYLWRSINGAFFTNKNKIFALIWLHDAATLSRCKNTSLHNYLLYLLDAKSRAVCGNSFLYKD